MTTENTESKPTNNLIEKTKMSVQSTMLANIIHLANLAAYTTIESGMSASKCRNLIGKAINEMKEYTKGEKELSNSVIPAVTIDVIAETLSDIELLELGFRFTLITDKLTPEEPKNTVLWRIPIWAYGLIVIGTKLTDIDNKDFVYGKSPLNRRVINDAFMFGFKRVSVDPSSDLGKPSDLPESAAPAPAPESTPSPDAEPAPTAE